MTQAVATLHPRSRRYITYEEFLADDSIERAEWVDGEVIEMPGVNVQHARITRFLIALLTEFTEAYDLGELFHDPFLVRLPTSGRSPDAIFIAKENLSRLREKDLLGPMDVAVEVVSPGGRRRDRREKYIEYEAAGVREYWLIDPRRQTAEFFRLDAAGKFVPVETTNGRFASEVLPGFWLDIDWLWDTPKVRDAEAALGLR